ncbi:penicillin acylase family protein [Myxococcus sp. RHSTA-1-4]|uniref:penicillin acylase family protein n=1 Tax=Myxococcus sp. RHSTA-1-4 TaxID=2874601 RepID=UPI001CBBDF97|nr:penicillin acylase family protein [Myxococcus sp. RHSTA-1-4]
MAGLSLAVATACGDDEDPPPPQPTPTPTYEATIRRTAHGIPHIKAKDMGSLGYGQGYAFAQDHVCILSEQILKVRGERARYLGQGNGSLIAASDFAYRLLDLPGRAQASFGKQPADVQALIKGYVAGFNRYLSETPAANLPQPCKGADWVKPITETDLLAYHISVGLAASSYQLILAIAAAQPPTVSGGTVGRPAPGSFKFERPEAHQVGSNGWALGKDKSAGGRGMVVANPHFPWEGELKLWESQLTVPGELNVYGVGLLGVPAVLIGFNENVAWTHTFSFGQRMTLYRLPLVDGKPTSYWYENQERQMTEHNITILVKLPEGSVTNVTRKMYTSHYGPIIAIPGSADWTTQFAYSLRDANIDNTALVAQFVGMDKSRSFKEFKDVYANVQGIPWVNTMAADKEGNTWYTDATPTPNLLPEAIAAWRDAITGTDPQIAAFWNTQGVVLLDGSKKVNEWQDEAGAPRPGIVPFSKVPQLDRTDFVFNANDSYWLANPLQPLTGFSPMHGFERTGQSPRTRMNATLLMEVREDGASGADGKFTQAELENAILSNRGMTAELLHTAVVQRCQGKTTASYQRTVNGVPETVTVNIQPACEALAGWDQRYDINSVGAVVWREFAGTAPAGTHTNGGTLYANHFDPNDPIATPNTLAPPPASGDDLVLTRLAMATGLLNEAGIPVNSRLGDVQYTPRVAGEKIPIHGGMLTDGTANVVSYGTFKSTTAVADFTAPQGRYVNTRTGLTDKGYVINNGSSFIMAMEFTENGPKGRAVLTYSQSSDPASPYFADQTRLFSQKQWRPILFSEAEVAAAPAEEQTLSGD